MTEEDNAPLPEAGTDSLERFIAAHVSLMSFFGFVGSLVLRADETRQIALKALAGTKDEERRRRVLVDQKEKDPTKRAYQRHQQTVLEMMLAREVDNFLAYLSELLAEAFLARPEMLKSGKQIRLDYVLEFDTMEELVQAIAERAVEEASYMSLNDLSVLFQDRGLDLFPGPGTLERAVRIVESRNLTVHNRGIVNARYVSRTGEGVAGTRLQLTTDDVFDDISFLASLAGQLDEQAVTKFNLGVSSFAATLDPS